MMAPAPAARIADIAFVRLAKHQLVANVKAAQAIGLTLPAPLLLQTLRFGASRVMTQSAALSPKSTMPSFFPRQPHLERDGVVMGLVARRIKQCNRTKS